MCQVMIKLDSPMINLNKLMTKHETWMTKLDIMMAHFDK